MSALILRLLLSAAFTRRRWPKGQGRQEVRHTGTWALDLLFQCRPITDTSHGIRFRL